MKKTLSLSLLLTSSIFAAGYQIPNNSINSQALSTANVANANGADASYYNPANMTYNDKRHSVELAGTYVQIEPGKYDSSNNAFHIESKRIQSVIPSLHYVSKELNDKGVRVGFSVVSPAGLTREWEDMPASATAKKYSLRTIELNPTVAIPLTSRLSLGLGFRYVMAEGEIALDGSSIPLTATTAPYTLDMKGSGEAAGYNLAVSYNATDALNLSATYRSAINLRLSGSGDTTFAGTPITSNASIAAPIPANFIFAVAYEFPTGTTLEVTYDKTYWSIVQETNFEFENPTLEATLGKTQPKEWHDTVAYRVGLTQKLDALTLMAGFAYSPSAADEQYVTFSSPESNFLTYSLGARYDINDSFDISIAGMLAQGEERTISQPTNPLGVNGVLSARDIYVLTFGAGYKF